MAFDYDDFLPNPLKRRQLFDLIKQMDESGLEAFFSRQKLRQFVFKSLNSSPKSLSLNKQHWERRWLRIKAVTAHQPNSVLGEILLNGSEKVVAFTLKYFYISAEVVNKLQIGLYCAVERLARVGRLSLLGRLASSKNPELSGKVHFRPGSFRRTWSTIFAAIEVGNVEYLQSAIALAHPGQLNLRGDQGITALGLAVMKDKAELVKVLLKAEAKVDEPSWRDETALCLALQMGVSRLVIQELIQAGANFNGRDLTGNSIFDQLFLTEYVNTN